MKMRLSGASLTIATRNVHLDPFIQRPFHPVRQGAQADQPVWWMHRQAFGACATPKVVQRKAVRREQDGVTGACYPLIWGQ
jgi:hypothetical protein